MRKLVKMQKKLVRQKVGLLIIEHPKRSQHEGLTLDYYRSIFVTY